MVTTSYDETAKIVNTQDGSEIVTIIRGGMRGAFSPDSSKVIIASRDHTAKIVDANTGKVITTIRHGAAIRSAAFSPDSSKVITASSDSTAKIVDLLGIPQDTSIFGVLLITYFERDRSRWKMPFRQSSTNLFWQQVRSLQGTHPQELPLHHRMWLALSDEWKQLLREKYGAPVRQVAHARRRRHPAARMRAARHRRESAA